MRGFNNIERQAIAFLKKSGLAYDVKWMPKLHIEPENRTHNDGEFMVDVHKLQTTFSLETPDNIAIMEKEISKHLNK